MIRRHTLQPTAACVLLAFAGAPAAHAQDTVSVRDDFDHISAAMLDLYAARDPADRPSPGRLFDGTEYFAVVSHREPGSGAAESHAEWTDVYFVTSGEAELVVGGRIDEATETAPGEIRGTAITGGERRRLAEGDVVHIPPGMAHHVLIDEGGQLTYLLIKIRETGE